MIKTLPTWHYDEFKQIGVDYADPRHAAAYDETFARFRGDQTLANEQLLDALGVRAGQTFIDLGCGTGDLAIQAAKRGAVVYAVDVSAAMLEVAGRKAEGACAITFCRGGFLTYEHQGDPADVVNSSTALHHLPDFWKLIGLRRVAAMLKPDGLFCLGDTVYSFDLAEYARFFDEKVAWFTEAASEEFGDEVAMAVREEFSTLDWIMEGLLTRAGFAIVQAEYPDGMWARYICRKQSCAKE